MARVVSKSIAIIGEGETEWFYFDSLRVACRFPFKVAPDFPQHSDIRHVLKLVESYIAKQYDYIVCLFDMDRLYQNPSEMQQYQNDGIRWKKVKILSIQQEMKNVESATNGRFGFKLEQRVPEGETLYIINNLIIYGNKTSCSEGYGG